MILSILALGISEFVSFAESKTSFSVKRTLDDRRHCSALVSTGGGQRVIDPCWRWFAM
jgi:hypothetical protein